MYPPSVLNCTPCGKTSECDGNRCPVFSWSQRNSCPIETKVNKVVFSRIAISNSVLEMKRSRHLQWKSSSISLRLHWIYVYTHCENAYTRVHECRPTVNMVNLVKPALAYRNVPRKSPLEINFIYLGNKYIYWISNTCLFFLFLFTFHKMFISYVSLFPFK